MSQFATTDPSIAYYAHRLHAPAPKGHLFASVCWLVVRHPVLHQLAARIPGAVDTDGDVLPWILADALADLDTHLGAWAEYTRTHRAPQVRNEADERRYDTWVDNGPRPSERVKALGVMSRTEISRLRLLAAFSDDKPVTFAVGMLWGFDPAGEALVRDWMTAIQAYRGDTTPIPAPNATGND
ncbi:hypothetical protein [Kineosporia sp. R_H_3]|uniref:hypothetical protein n=1 Tax=Kineosporia sp. R_H_3 TaxID=1961848 RepID=UPI000B4AE3DE|nr:hypothetical protein [Kineosporia sp. R_H_3]